MPRTSNNWLSVEGMTKDEIEQETEAIQAFCDAQDEGCICIDEEAEL